MRRGWSGTLLVVGGLLTGAAPVGAQDPAAGFLESNLATGALPSARWPDMADARAVLDTFYAARGYAPIWDRGAGFDEAAYAAIAALRASAERGLDPRDYDVTLLDSLALAPPDANPAHRAERDLLLTLAVTRYLRDLRDGRVALTPFGHLKAKIPAPEDAALLQRATDGEPIEALAREVEPHLAQYRNLLRLLSYYRALADTFRFHRLVQATVRPGRPYAGSAELRRRLVAFGDLDTAAVTTPGRYDSTLAAAVRHFQVRHALTPDGVLGASTRQALGVSPRTRVTQLILALERLRWLPPLEGSRLVVVNIPAFELFAFDSIGGTGTPTLRMPVVLGSAFDHQTPVLLQALQAVQFRPYWNVPAEIFRREYLPRLAADPLLLRKSHMEILGARDSVLGDSVTAKELRELQTPRLRVRQRPGPWNALGATKFSFVNSYDVYLHGTPDTQAFRRARRDASHGCIRVRDPAKLAEWVLDGSGWGRGAIDSAMTGTADTVRAEPIFETSVLIFYTTAAAMPDGEARFYEDIYTHDRDLVRQLRVRQQLSGRTPAVPGPS